MGEIVLHVVRHIEGLAPKMKTFKSHYERGEEFSVPMSPRRSESEKAEESALFSATHLKIGIGADKHVEFFSSSNTDAQETLKKIKDILEKHYHIKEPERGHFPGTRAASEIGDMDLQRAHEEFGLLFKHLRTSVPETHQRIHVVLVTHGDNVLHDLLEKMTGKTMKDLGGNLQPGERFQITFGSKEHHNIPFLEFRKFRAKTHYK